MNERFAINAAVYLILREGEKILLSKRAGSGYMDGWYSLPAGHLDGNESSISALIREIKEEIGLDIFESALKFVHVAHRTGDREYIDIFFECTNWTGEPKILEPNKCTELLWVDIDKLPDKTIPYVQKVIGNYKNNIKFSEHGWG